MEVDIPVTGSISVFVCVCLYVAEMNLVTDYPLEFSAAMFLGWVVFMTDRLRANLRIFNRLWIFLIALVVYYLVGQGMVFYVWHPFWDFFEYYLNEFYETKFMYSIYNNYPSIIVFLRHQSLCIIKMLVVFILYYKTLAGYVLTGECIEDDYDDLEVEPEGIHEDAFQQLLYGNRNRPYRPNGRFLD